MRGNVDPPNFAPRRERGGPCTASPGFGWWWQLHGANWGCGYQGGRLNRVELFSEEERGCHLGVRKGEGRRVGERGIEGDKVYVPPYLHWKHFSTEIEYFIFHSCPRKLVILQINITLHSLVM